MLTADQKLRLISERTGYPYLHRDPDDDPMIGGYDPETGDWLLVEAKAIAERADGGVPMATDWLWEFLLSIAAACCACVVIHEGEDDFRQGYGPFIDEQSAADFATTSALMKGGRWRVIPLLHEQPDAPGEGKD